MAVGVKVDHVTSTLYIHKYEVWQERGGPEEGTWWYTQGTPVGLVATIPLDRPVDFESYNWNDNPRADVEFAYALCREFNAQEGDRDKEYGFTSVLSYRETHYQYDLSDTYISDAYPVKRPHYE